MKSHTDLSQSKKLAEFLPLESADFSWTNFSSKGQSYAGEWQAINETPKEVEESVLSAFYTMGDKWKIVPCWSLAALFNVIESKCSYFELVHLKTYRLSAELDDIYGEDLIDVLYEMVLKLHERKLL